MRIFYKKIFAFSDKNERHEVPGYNISTSLADFFKPLKLADSAAAEGEFDYEGLAGYFLSKDDVFLELNEGGQDSPFIEVDDTFSTKKQNSTIKIIARKNGYPVVIDGVLSLFEPCHLTEDKIHLYFIVMPVKEGKKKLLETFFASLTQAHKDKGDDAFNKEDIREKIYSGKVHTITISMGTPCTPGRAESLSIKVPEDEKKEGNPGIIADLYSRTTYREIAEGTLIAEKISGIRGEDGIDAFGNVIPAIKWNEIPFTAGENVIMKELDDGKSEFTAAKSGILIMSRNEVKVLEELRITGDVCAESGSIEFSKDVTIDGSVHSLFHVKCGGNLTIKGIVENGAAIECGGDFTASKGILGEKTSVIIKGNACTGNINEAYIRVAGDLTVTGTLYSATVFCGGVLRVEDPKIKNKSRGCIVGGTVTAMKGMDLHSIGSQSSKTELIFGVDHELVSKKGKMEESVPVIKRKILRLQDKVGIDFSRPDVVERLKRLSDSQKKKVKVQLEEIKKIVYQKNVIEAKVKQLESLVVTPDIEDLSISVTSHILPDVSLAIGDDQLVIKREYGPVTIRLIEDKIDIQEAE